MEYRIARITCPCSGVAHGRARQNPDDLVVCRAAKWRRHQHLVRGRACAQSPQGWCKCARARPCHASRVVWARVACRRQGVRSPSQPRLVGLWLLRVTMPHRAASHRTANHLTWPGLMLRVATPPHPRSLVMPIPALVATRPRRSLAVEAPATSRRIRRDTSTVCAPYPRVNGRATAEYREAPLTGHWPSYASHRFAMSNSASCTPRRGQHGELLANILGCHCYDFVNSAALPHPQMRVLPQQSLRDGAPERLVEHRFGLSGRVRLGWRDQAHRP